MKKKIVALVLSAILLLSFSGCEALYVAAIEKGLTAELAQVVDISPEEALPKNPIVDNVLGQIEFMNWALSPEQTGALTHSLMADFSATVDSVQFTGPATATATCTVANADFTSANAAFYASLEALAPEVLVNIALPEGEFDDSFYLDNYLACLASVTNDSPLTDTVTIDLALVDGKWEPDFGRSLGTPLYHIALGGYDPAFPDLDQTLILAGYTDFFAGLNGITGPDLVAKNLIDHPLMAGLKSSANGFTDAQSARYYTGLMRHFDLKADRVEISGNTATLTCTATNADMSKVSAAFEAKLDSIADDYATLYRLAQMTEAQIIDYLYGILFDLIDQVKAENLLTREITLELTHKDGKWLVNKGNIENNEGLFNLMFGDLFGQGFDNGSIGGYSFSA